jgi:[acyl-carrier-protein] S-malonyltransferase
MHRESLENPGAMAAVIGMAIETVGEIVALAGERGVIGVANHNTAEQIVITGEKDPLSHAISIIKERGGRAVPLRVSGAWHCRLMEKAVDDFRQFMKDITFSSPETTMLFNATADMETHPEKIKEIMALQLISPVRWYDIILKMLEDGVNVFVEVGPKKVLTGLLKKIIPGQSEAQVYNVEDLESLKRLLETRG